MTARHPGNRDASTLAGDVSVLVIDDDVDIRSTLRDILEEEGYSTLTAPDGAAALELLRSHTPRLILLDLMMPVMDGGTFRKIQLDDLALAALPTVVMTARGTTLAASGLFVNAYLAKPLALDELLRIVAHYCD